MYSVNGVLVAGFDNERGKGDHCHLEGGEHDFVTKIVGLIEQRSALTAGRLLEGGAETEEQDTDES